MELSLVPIAIPEGCNVVLGQTHFIKTAEDLYEILVGAAPGAQFGVAFTEASGPCLIRVEGTDAELSGAAAAALEAIGAGHVFCVFLRNLFPVNVLDRIKACPEVCRVFCATANPLQVVVASSPQGRGVLGVIDGSPPAGVETAADRTARRELLRKFGYKL